jgi:hypothetical protein
MTFLLFCMAKNIPKQVRPGRIGMAAEMAGCGVEK